MTIPEQIKYWQSKFRIIQNWKIVYVCGTGDFNGLARNAELRKAFIYPYRGRPPKDYIFHEIQHVCMYEMLEGSCDIILPGMANSTRMEKEELFIQDLCLIIFNRKLKREPPTS